MCTCLYATEEEVPLPGGVSESTGVASPEIPLQQQQQQEPATPTSPGTSDAENVPVREPVTSTEGADNEGPLQAAAVTTESPGMHKSALSLYIARATYLLVHWMEGCTGIEKSSLYELCG